MESKNNGEMNGVNRFSWQRVGRLMRIGAMQPEARVSIRAAVICILVLCVLNWMTEIGEGDPFSVYASLVWHSLPLLSLLVGTIGLSVSMSSLDGKGMRVNSIMIPARRSEKFIARVAVSLIGSVGTLLVLAAIFIGVFSLLSVLFDPAGSLDGCFAVTDTSTRRLIVVNVSGAEDFKFSVMSKAFILTGLTVFTLAAFLLGSVLWKGASWPATMACIVAFSILCGIALDAIIPESHTAEQVKALFEPAASAVYGGGLLALASLMIWAAYRLFARMQAVKPKLTSILRLPMRH